MADKPGYYTEKQAAWDLDILGYTGKWRKAIQMTDRTLATEPDPNVYWSSVREHFLGLGGRYLTQDKGIPSHPQSLN